MLINESQQEENGPSRVSRISQSSAPMQDVGNARTAGHRSRKAWLSRSLEACASEKWKDMPSGSADECNRGLMHFVNVN